MTKISVKYIKSTHTIPVRVVPKDTAAYYEAVAEDEGSWGAYNEY